LTRLRFLSKIRPEYVFVVLALFFQWRFNKITPPFQVPDEFNHFYKAYKISQGEFLPIKEDKRLGGTIPWSIREFARPYFKVANNVKYITSEGEINGSFDIKYSSRDSLFLDFPNTAIYSPISYAPQAFALWLSQKFDASVARMYYNGRYMIFLCWLVAMFFVIRMMPFGKWLMTLFVLLPMNLYLVNSFSADTVTNIISFLFIAFVLKLSQQKEKISYRNIVVLLFLIVFLAFAKIVYIGLVVLLFVIPPKQFKHISLYISSFMLLFLSAFLVANYWSEVVLEYYIPYLSYNPNFRDGITLSSCANYHLQKQFILDHRWYFTNMIYHSITDHPGTYLYTYIGAFGNMDLLLPKIASWIAYGALGFVAITEKNEKVTPWLFKPVFVAAVLISFAMLLLSQHLTWDCIGEGVVDLIQGRYLIPLMPLLFLVLSNTYSPYQWLAPPLVILAALYLHRASCKIIYPRYFKESYYAKTEFICDAEKVNEKGQYITTNDSIFLEAGKFRTDSFAHSGRYSAYFDPWIQFNMTYRFKNLRLGDLVEISAWRRGTMGQMVISGHGKDCGDFFMNNDKVLYYDERGWGYMNSVFTMTKDCDSNQVSFFLWCPDSTKRIYFDDLKFSIKHYKGRYVDSLYIPL
jgi:uncharacterized membrane protein